MLIVIGRKGVSSCATDTARLWRQASTRSTLLIPFNWILFIYDFVIRGWVKSIINRLREKRKCNVNYFSCRDQYCFLLLLLFCTQIDCFWVMQLWHSWISFSETSKVNSCCPCYYRFGWLLLSSFMTNLKIFLTCHIITISNVQILYLYLFANIHCKIAVLSFFLK